MGGEMTKKLRPIEVYDLMVDAAFGIVTPFEPGQYRLFIGDPPDVLMVKLLQTGREHTDHWTVVDILDIDCRQGLVKEKHLSRRVYNEMEVLAWAAR